MPSAVEYAQFRRLIGDFNVNLVSNSEIDFLLDSTVFELTGDFATPVVGNYLATPIVHAFDLLVTQYHNEVLYKAAINWWWNRLAELQEKHSISTGTMTQQVSEKWDRAWQMIQSLEATYDKIQSLQIDIWQGNYSRYSKQTLRRIGGIQEENTNA